MVEDFLRTNSIIKISSITTTLIITSTIIMEGEGEILSHLMDFLRLELRIENEIVC